MYSFWGLLVMDQGVAGLLQGVCYSTPAGGASI